MGKRHAENLRRLVPEARLVGVADVDRARAARVAEELEIDHSFNSLEAMLESKDIQAVVIATPDKFHGQAIRTAAAARKNILCEKPLASTLAYARRGQRSARVRHGRYSSRSGAVRRPGGGCGESEIPPRCDR